MSMRLLYFDWLMDYRSWMDWAWPSLHYRRKGDSSFIRTCHDRNSYVSHDSRFVFPFLDIRQFQVINGMRHWYIYYSPFVERKCIVKIIKKNFYVLYNTQIQSFINLLSVIEVQHCVTMFPLVLEIIF